MKNLVNTPKIKILAVVLSLVVIVGTVGYFIFPIASSAVNSVTFGLFQVSAAATNSLDNKTYDELQKENQSLKEENLALRNQLADYFDLREENQKLWSFYDIKKENPTYTYVPSSVIRRDSTSDYYSFVIDAGTSSGVEKNDAVISENGLVGIVTTADMNTSVVKTILSPEVKIGVTDKNTKETGIVSGNSKYCDDNLTIMSKISSEQNVVQNDIITTSGIGGLYPPNIIIGKVQSVDYDQFDASKYAVISPYEDIRKVSNVLVVTNFDSKGQIVVPTQTEPATESSSTNPTPSEVN